MTDPLFPSTQWSAIRAAAGRVDSATQREALDQLLRLYMPALKTHLVLRKKITADAADDFLQDFVSKKILEKDLLLLADPNKGKFRSLLLTILDRMIIDHHRLRRLPIEPLKADHIAEDDRSAAMDAFDIAWARLVFAETLEMLLEDCQSNHQRKVWLVFVERMLRPLVGQPQTTFKELVESPAFDNEKAAQNALATAKRKFQRFAKNVVKQYIHDREDVTDEITTLLNTLEKSNSFDIPLHLLATETDGDSAAMLNCFRSGDVTSVRDSFSVADGDSSK